MDTYHVLNAQLTNKEVKQSLTFYILFSQVKIKSIPLTVNPKNIIFAVNRGVHILSAIHQITFKEWTVQCSGGFCSL